MTRFRNRLTEILAFLTQGVKHIERLILKEGYCHRQPLKLANLVCCSGLMRILRTDPEQQRTVVHASDGSIRTHSHTAREVLWAGRTIDGRDSPPRSLLALLRSRKAAPPRWRGVAPVFR